MSGAAEHLTIQDAVEDVDSELLGHFSYEEKELAEPLAQFGFYEGQV